MRQLLGNLVALLQLVGDLLAQFVDVRHMAVHLLVGGGNCSMVRAISVRLRAVLS